MKHIFIILILILISFQAVSQRGGGGGGSRQSSRSSFSSSRRWGSSYSSYPSNNVPLTWSQTFQNLLIVFGFGGAIVAIGAVIVKANAKKRMQKVKRILNEFQAKSQANICTLNEDQINKTIDWFMGNNWKIQFRSKDQSCKGQFTFQMKNLIKKSDFIYEIQAAGWEEDLKDSQLTGILLFQNDYLTFCFEKLYSDTTKAGQTGKWDVLIYQGVQQGQIFAGEWYYNDFRGDYKYSGQMRMINV